ncbi:uncharacterized protein ACA1_228050, partial [Acanthamoeba castellanii str. Neff]
MQGQTSAKVKGLPLHLSSAALHELCSHYGALRIRPLSGPMGTVVVEFPSEDAAMRGVAALSGLRLWDRTLTATLLPANAATATTDTPTPMPSRDPASALGKRPLLADALHEAQLNGATSSSASANANSELGPEYLYPPLDVDIVANIVRALAEVPHSTCPPRLGRRSTPPPAPEQGARSRSGAKRPSPHPTTISRPTNPSLSPTQRSAAGLTAVLCPAHQVPDLRRTTGHRPPALAHTRQAVAGQDCRVLLSLSHSGGRADRQREARRAAHPHDSARSRPDFRSAGPTTIRCTADSWRLFSTLDKRLHNLRSSAKGLGPNNKKEEGRRRRATTQHRWTRQHNKSQGKMVGAERRAHAGRPLHLLRFFFLRDYSRTCGREEEEEFSSFARSLTAATAGQRRVVHASAAYPLDQARTSSCRLDPALRQGLRASYAKYARELRASPHYDLWLLYDIGTEAPPNLTADNEVLAEYYELQREYPGLGLFLYNASDVKALLPTAAYIQKDATPNFWFHDASLFLWESELYIWTVEHDAIYFGDVSMFLDEHNTNTADYIADYSPLRPDWYHWKQSTWRPPYDKAVFKKQHVERHSTALLRYLYSITLLDV